MFNYAGKTALITGASSGIGESFTRELAARGMNVVLVARSEAKLRHLAQELSQRHKVRAEAITIDLSQEKATRIVQQAVQQFGLEVDLLINNAASFTFAPFEQSDSLDNQQMIMLNIAAMVELTHAFIPAMLARGTGAVLNVGSMASIFPIPYQAVYAATKAFVLSFSEGLWVEYRDQGLRVLALCPGPTRTSFLVTSLIEPEQAAPPEQVVVAGLRALEQGRSSFIPGAVNNLQSRILPIVLGRSLMARLVGRTVRSGLKAESSSPSGKQIDARTPYP
jgi:short-subunit dehydrogenase